MISYGKNENENLLRIGSKYINLVIENGGVKLQTDYKFEKYASSLWYQQLAVKHVNNKATASLTAEIFKNVIERFDSIKDDFEEKCISAIRKFISLNDQDETLIPLMEKLLEIIPSSDKLRYLFADFVTSYCIDKINAKSISEPRALELLIKAIVACPDNHKTAKNLAIFVGMHLSDDNFNRKLKSLIPSLQKIESESLYDSFQNELLPLRDELNSLLRKSNINYSRVRDCISTIDELINSVEPLDDDTLN